MSIGAGLAIASSGLTAIERQLAVVSQNVANANTPGYSAETETLSSTTAGGIGTGVISGVATRQLNTDMQSQLNASISNQSYQSAMAAALSGIDQVMGAPGEGNDLPSLVGAVQSSFATLLSDPSNPAQQSALVTAAQTLTSQINSIAGAIGTARQAAQTTMVADIKNLNRSLTQVGTLNTQIVALKQQGLSTADLENQRNVLVQTIASLTGAKSVPQPNGTIALYTTTGLQLPTDANHPLSTPSATLGANAYYPGGGVPAITLNGQDVTPLLTDGTIGASLQLRDATLPKLQAGLDSFSQGIASRFSAQGLTLFSDSSGNVPNATGSVGFSNAVTVNPAVVKNPALVRDGTQAIAGNATGASSFTPNPPGGPAGFSTMIQRVLKFAFGKDVQAGVSQPVTASSGLGPSGTIALNYTGAGTISTVATNFASDEAAISSDAQAAKASSSSLTNALTTQFSATNGVSVDQQMGVLVALQNAYAANAKIVGIAQQMWQTMEAMIS
ncbi:flagellar hook-associated protein FlgK [Acidiphilium sp. AL]|uniref:Flagellar hook-associated protein 1 n=1 Tax=Acidiphilium iwatense TaxID=768198 RepID=A0ABS9DUV8_9PROT|nr:MULTISPECIES: flagellar hook-associated protein FlgK [Acidiphilium]MCF3946517.1 flagellar hook-associated protein FlgK [Acidiphilium iwatense]MCU4160418.1 flagellar hook-associated protein FlgK [Acidiphilium sp. AL]